MTLDSQLDQLVKRLDPHGQLRRSWALTGGVSAQVTALEVERADGSTQKMIVRQHGEVDLHHNPHIAADEFRLLHALRSADLPVPTPYHVDSSGEIFGTPCIVLEFIEGQTDFAPVNQADYLRQCAVTLTRIHQVAHAALGLGFLPARGDRDARLLDQRPDALDETLQEGRIRAALEAVWPLPQKNAPVLLHGDFWPGNLLWHDGQLVGVVDWEDAARGDPLADLASTRLELLWAFGLDAMQAFTGHYRSVMPGVDFTDLPYRDLYAALRPIATLDSWTDDPAAQAAFRAGHQAFVAQAFAALC